MSRPSIAILGALWGGIALAGSFPFPLWVWAVTLAAIVVLMLFASRAGLATVVFLAGVFVLGCLRSPDARWKEPALHGDPGTEASPCIVRVRVSSPLEVCREPVKVRVERALVGEPWVENRLVFLRGPGVAGALSDGAATAVGTFHPPRARLNPYGRNTARLYERQGVVGSVVARSFADANTGVPFLARQRSRIKDLIHSAVEGPAAGVLEALLLGERADLDPEVRDVMVRAGTYHVVAISGLHVGIVVLLVTSFITATGLPRTPRLVFTLACVLAYVVFTGARPSALRAGAFFLLLSLVRCLQWKVDMPNCVCAAGIILLAAFPYLAWDVGFRLSLAAVFGITLFVPMLQAPGGKSGGIRLRAKRYIQLGITASFAAQAATLPILLYHFGRVSLMGIVSNLAILPIVTLAVAAGLEASILVAVWARLALVFMKGAAGLVTLMISIMSFSTAWVDPVMFPGRPGTMRLIIYIIGMTYIGLLKPDLRRFWRILGMAALFVFLVFPTPRRQGRALVLTFIHVGDGDACLIEFADGSTMLVDTGTGSAEHDAGRFDVLPILAMKGIKRVDRVIITHSHDDHYGGLRSLAGNVDIGCVLVGTREGEAGYQAVLELCRQHGARIQLVGRGDTLRMGGASLEILHPSAAYTTARIEDANAQSVVFRLVYGNIRVLFTGDVTPEVQQELVALGFDLSCEVLKVPHHGAPGGVAPTFADACGSRFAIIPVGSRFASHPCPETIRLLEADGMRVFTTLRDGAVTLVTDGMHAEVRTEILGRVGVLPTDADWALDGGARP